SISARVSLSLIERGDEGGNQALVPRPAALGDTSHSRGPRARRAASRTPGHRGPRPRAAPRRPAPFAEPQVEPLARPPSLVHAGLAASDRGVLRSRAVMKAAVLHEIGGIPRYEDFPDPVAGDDEVVIDVKAVAVENVDKRIAAGMHYASREYNAQLPAIPAFDGIGALPDGTVVGFGNPRRPYGALAEK